MASHPATQLAAAALGQRPLATAVVAVFVAGFAAWALLRVFGLERGWPLVPLMAFTPYACALSVLPLAAAVALGPWPLAVAAALTTGALLCCVAPRGWRAPTGSRRDTPRGRNGRRTRSGGGPRLRVLTSNLLYGGADPGVLLELVRRHSVDLLALQEYTPAADEALRRAGLDHLLPHCVAHPTDDPGGSALYSRFPLTGAGYRRQPPKFGQCHAVVQVPGAAELLVESVHPAAPAKPCLLPHWRTGLAAQPPATPDGPVRVLLGDFNATLDHAPLRRLLRTGYRSAAAMVGAGLAATWPYDGTRLPRVTIDHVLVDPRVAVHAVSVHRIDGTDHRAVFAELSLPPRALSREDVHRPGDHQRHGGQRDE